MDSKIYKNLVKLMYKVKNFFYITKKDLLTISIIILVSVFVDLLTKHIVFSANYHGYYILPIFNILKVKNFGISFGLFNENPEISYYFILVFDIFIITYLMHLIKIKNEYKKPKLFLYAIGLILGGAFGNFIDRIITGSVRDFLDFHIGDAHWPCFNVADICVCVGVGIWIICELFLRKKS